MSFWQAVSFVLKHAALVSLIIEAIERKKVPASTLVTLVKRAMTEASDAEMRAYLAEKR